MRPRATASTRSTAARSGGWGPGPRNQRRAARRARGAGAAQRLGVGGVDPGRQFVEQVGLIGQERRLAGEHGHEVAPGHGTGQGEKLVTDAVADEAPIDVGGVVDRFEAEAATQRVGL